MQSGLSSTLNAVYVSSNPADTTADFYSIQDAIDHAMPGYTIYVMPGAYSPFDVNVSGTSDSRVNIIALSNEDELVTIDGNGSDVRGLISVTGESYVTISGFNLRNAPIDGIFVEGSAEGESGIEILNNSVDTTGNSGIYVSGIVMRHTAGVGEYRLSDVTIDGNRVTNTNVGDGVNEAITLGGGVSGFVISNNHVHDSEQYGIDVKAGATDGKIFQNTIHGIEKHGIYIDAGSRTVSNIDIFQNSISGSRNGIVLARESNRDPENPNLYNINVFNNLIYQNEKYGVMAYRHKDDSGLGTFGNISIEDNYIISNGLDAVRLGGIGDFANDFSVYNNMSFGNRSEIWEDIGDALLSRAPSESSEELQYSWALGTDNSDTIIGDAGNNLIVGGLGDDTLRSASGSDMLFGGSGNDRLFGGDDSDNLFGGEGNDVLRGGGGNDVLDGGQGNDQIYGGAGEDILTGGNGDDSLEGNAHSDEIFGGNGDDFLNGGDGFDFLHGEAGDDILLGGRGNDWLEGGEGSDILRGQEHNDTFVFKSVSHSTVSAADIIDGMDGVGSPGGDVIDLSAIDANELLDGDQAFIFLGEQTRSEGIAFGAGGIWLQDVGGQTRVFANTDGDNFIDLAIWINDGIETSSEDYIASDFVL